MNDKDPILDNEFLKDKESFREMMSLYQDKSYFERLKMMYKGLHMPRDTKEYKLARIELQRLMAPAAAVIIPIFLMIALIALAKEKVVEETTFETEILEVEEMQEDLEDVEDDQPPPEPIDDIVPEDVNFATDVQMDVAAPAPDGPVSAQPSPVDAVAMIKSPVVLQGIFGSRDPGTRGKKLGRYGGSGSTEACVMRALRWLKTKQLPDGSWKVSTKAASNEDEEFVDPTGLAMLCFLSHGETPSSEEFGDTVKKGIEYLMESGHHSKITALHALCEAFGLTKNPLIKDVANRAVAEVAKQQAHSNKVLGYIEAGFTSMALRSAQISGFDVPDIEPAISNMVSRIMSQGDHSSGGFDNRKGGPAAGTKPQQYWHFFPYSVALQYLGSGQHPTVAKTMNRLDPLGWEPTLGEFEYACCPVRGTYWATMIYFNAQGNRWTKWNSDMVKSYVSGQNIIKGQYKDHNGKEQEIGNWTCADQHIGEKPFFPTCYIALQLMVYYRFTPTSSKEAWDNAGVGTQATAITESNDIAVETDL